MESDSLEAFEPNSEQDRKKLSASEKTEAPKSTKIDPTEALETIAAIARSREAQKLSSAKANLLPVRLMDLADGSIYDLLGISSSATHHTIHRRFLRLTRQVLLSGGKDKLSRQAVDLLGKLWSAHDTLSDPRTRRDYDKRILGLAGKETAVNQFAALRQDYDETSSTIKLGELLQVAGWLEKSELRIACDMHKAMPEMQFGQFLVKQGFIERYQLKAVLLAQRLLRQGLATISQVRRTLGQVTKYYSLEEILVTMPLLSEGDVARVNFKLEDEPQEEEDFASNSLKRVWEIPDGLKNETLSSIDSQANTIDPHFVKKKSEGSMATPGALDT